MALSFNSGTSTVARTRRRLVVILTGGAFVATMFVGTANASAASSVSACNKQNTSLVDRATCIAKVMDQKNIPYKWGGTSTSGFDCSGLVQYAFEKAGSGDFPRTTFQQVAKAGKSAKFQSVNTKAAKKGDFSNLKKGDLVYFYNNNHVGIYQGNGKFTHAPSSGKTVRTDKLKGYYQGQISKVVRVKDKKVGNARAASDDMKKVNTKKAGTKGSDAKKTDTKKTTSKSTTSKPKNTTTTSSTKKKTTTTTTKSKSTNSTKSKSTKSTKDSKPKKTTTTTKPKKSTKKSDESVILADAQVGGVIPGHGPLR